MEKPAKEETVVENATPDYAAGLVSTQVGLRALGGRVGAPVLALAAGACPRGHTRYVLYVDTRRMGA